MDIDKALARVGEAVINLSKAKLLAEEFYNTYLPYPRMFTDEERHDAIIQLQQIQFRIGVARSSIGELLHGPFFTRNKEDEEKGRIPK